MKKTASQKRAVGVAQAVQQLPSKREALSSNPSTAKRKIKSSEIIVSLKKNSIT
jgi:hypothetical protein